MIVIGDLVLLAHSDSYSVRSLGSSNAVKQLVVIVDTADVCTLGLYNSLTQEVTGFEGEDVGELLNPCPHDSLTLVEWLVKGAAPTPIDLAAYMSLAYAAGVVTRTPGQLSNAAMMAKVGLYSGAVHDLLGCGAITSQSLIASLKNLLEVWRENKQKVNPKAIEAITTFITAYPEGFEDATEEQLHLLIQVGATAAIANRTP